MGLSLLVYWVQNLNGDLGVLHTNGRVVSSLNHKVATVVSCRGAKCGRSCRLPGLRLVSLRMSSKNARNFDPKKHDFNVKFALRGQLDDRFDSKMTGKQTSSKIFDKHLIRREMVEYLMKILGTIP